MDIISTLTNVIKDLISKRTTLQKKIHQDIGLLNSQKKEIVELQKEVIHIEESIKITEQELEHINKTIEQTESGYKKILEAGETLMSVVTENITEYKNIDYKPLSPTFN